MLQLTHNALIAIRSTTAKLEQKRRIQARAKLRSVSAPLFDALTDRIAIVLRTGQPTKFEYEGACRAGLRRSLVLKGWKWNDADALSDRVVAAALKQIGAVRPSWIEGQPEHVALHEPDNWFCKRCGSAMPEDRRATGGRPLKYCSRLCSEASYQDRARKAGERITMAEWLALCAERSERTLRERARDCERCKAPFLSVVIDQRFCSDPCRIAASRTLPDRQCKHCGTTFRPRSIDARNPANYCSRDCSDKGRTKPRGTRTCAECSSVFTLNFPSDRRIYCSPVCNPYTRRKAMAAASQFNCDSPSDDARPEGKTQ